MWSDEDGLSIRVPRRFLRNRIRSHRDRREASRTIGPMRLFLAIELPDAVKQQLTAVQRSPLAALRWAPAEQLHVTLKFLGEVPDADVPAIIEHLAKLPTAEDATLAVVERSIHSTKSGARLEVRVELRRLDWRGRPAALAVITNLTGLAETERRFRTLVEYAADGLGLLDDRGVVLYMSPGGERTLGFAPGELVGRSAAELTHPEDAHLLTAPAPGETRTRVVRVRHAGDGAWRWIETTNTNLTHEFSIRDFQAAADRDRNYFSKEGFGAWAGRFVAGEEIVQLLQCGRVAGKARQHGLG